MTKTIKLFMAFLVCITCIGIGNEAVNAKAVTDIKVKLINKKINSDTSEAIVAVKNKKDNNISVSKVILKKRQETDMESKTEDEQVELKTKKEHWVEMKRNNKKYKIKAHAKKYVDVNIKGVSAGKYKITFHIKSKGQVIKKNVYFIVEKTRIIPESIKKPQVFPVEKETTIDYEEIPSGSAPVPSDSVTEPSDSASAPSYSAPAPVDSVSEPAPAPAQTAISKNTVSERKRCYNAKQILLNGDFRVNSKGKVEAVIFSETYYKTAYKTKIDLRIQRKTGKGFKTYKRYKQIKKSNIAFLNKNFKIKKSGQYRMYVKIISYKKKNKKSIRYYKSKTVTYRR